MAVLITEAAQLFTMPVTKIVMVGSPSANGAAKSPVSAFSVSLLQISVCPATASGVTDAPAKVTADGNTSVSVMYGTSASDATAWRIVIVYTFVSPKSAEASSELLSTSSSGWSGLSTDTTSRLLTMFPHRSVKLPSETNCPPPPPPSQPSSTW